LTTSPATIDSPRAGRAPSATSALPVLTAIPDLDPLVELVHAVADGECPAHRPLGVVAESSRGAEDRHDRVADELLHGAAERLELAADVVVVRREDRRDVLGVELLRPPGEADEVDEHDGDDPSLVLRGRGLGLERLPARQAEPGDVRVLLPAVRAREHGQSVDSRAVAATIPVPWGCARAAKGNGL
jgi:hypothetical protein